MSVLILRSSVSQGEGGGDGTDFTQILHSRTFGGGTPGASISATNYSQVNGTVFSDDIAGPNGESTVAKNTLSSGTTEGAWGWWWTYPGGNVLSKGDEIWFRCKAYHPTGFSFVTDSFLKFMRVHQQGAAGFIDLYYGSTGGWRFQSEVAPDDANFAGSNAIAHNTWETFEWYVRLSDETGTGNALVRAWKNDTFLGQFSHIKTLSNSSGVSDYLIWHDYWNGGVPQNQSCYHAHFAVAVKSAGWRDDTPYLSTDSGGRLRIGTGNP